MARGMRPWMYREEWLTAWQVQAHDLVAGLQKRRVHGHVGRASAVGLHVDGPLRRVHAVCLQGTVACKILDLEPESGG